MAGWSRQNDFDDLIRASVSSFAWGPVSPDDVFRFVKATIGQESEFNPAATRQEPGGDASIGLMQVLYSTAQSLGYPEAVGSPNNLSGLYDPGANIFIGTKLINDLVSRLGPDWAAVASAYNGGIRPSLGMGVRATKTVTVCLARDVYGNCLRTYTAQPGEFGNQPYVDSVMSNLAYFGGTPPEQQAGPATGGGPPATPGLTVGDVATSPLTWFLLLMAGGLGWLALRGSP